MRPPIRSAAAYSPVAAALRRSANVFPALSLYVTSSDVPTLSPERKLPLLISRTKGPEIYSSRFERTPRPMSSRSVSAMCSGFIATTTDTGKTVLRNQTADGRRAVLRSQVLELHGISHGSAGARSIATMATRRSYQMGRWLAGRLMKELGLVSCAADSPV